jgi:hypothetical protein
MYEISSNVQRTRVTVHLYSYYVVFMLGWTEMPQTAAASEVCSRFRGGFSLCSGEL